MIKEAYDAGVQQALFDAGITKLAGSWWKATTSAAKKLLEAYERNPVWQQYLMAGGGGALGGAGLGALTGDTGTGALTGLAAGLGARGAFGARGALRELAARRALSARQAANAGLLKRVARSKPVRTSARWLAEHPAALAGIGAGTAGLGGIGLGALRGGKGGGE